MSTSVFMAVGLYCFRVGLYCFRVGLIVLIVGLIVSTAQRLFVIEWVIVCE